MGGALDREHPPHPVLDPLLRGSVAGIVILIMCLTGVALTLERQINNLADRMSRAPVSAGVARLPLDAITDTSTSGPQTLSAITIYSKPDEPVALAYRRERTVLVDPYTARVWVRVQSQPGFLCRHGTLASCSGRGTPWTWPWKTHCQRCEFHLPRSDPERLRAVAAPKLDCAAASSRRSFPSQSQRQSPSDSLSPVVTIASRVNNTAFSAGVYAIDTVDVGKHWTFTGGFPF